MEAWVKEHNWYICLYCLKKFVVVKYSINLDHKIQLKNTSILAKKSRQMDQIMREAVVIELNPNNMNREDGFSLSWAWKPLICDMKEWRQSLTKESAPFCRI
jgi:plasmid rolling circle replication initiator protein Rep